MLELKFVNSFAASVQGTGTFTLLNAATLTGTFANVTTNGFRLATTDGLGSFAVNFSGTALRSPTSSPSRAFHLGPSCSPVSA